MTQLLEKTNQQQIEFHFFSGEKFKTNVLGILFRTPLLKKNATKMALLAEVLKNGCQSYSSKQAVSIANEEMYGSIFDISILKKGDEQILFVYFEYLQCNEDLLEEGITFLRKMLEEPLVENGGFVEKIVQQEKEFVRKKIQGKKDSKRIYAKVRCLEEMFHGEPFSVYADGYEEDLEQLNGKNLYLYYEELKKKSKIDILFLGDSNQNTMVQKNLEFLVHDEAEAWTLPVPVVKKSRERKKEVIETLDVAQSRLCMGLTTDISSTWRELPALMVTNEILGGNSSSLLFEIIREREGLCYYINSMVYRLKGILMIQAGIREQDYERTIRIIEIILKNLRTKRIEAQRVEQAKEALINFYTEMMDSQTSQLNFVVDEYLAGSRWTYEKFLRKLNHVTVEDVYKIARNIEIDTIYFLKGKEQ